MSVGKVVSMAGRLEQRRLERQLENDEAYGKNDPPAMSAMMGDGVFQRSDWQTARIYSFGKALAESGSRRDGASDAEPDGFDYGGRWQP
ncbi:hypothetical protein SAMN06265795_11051 [Noviherbaspirillum humi]|uniref:Uncharacterized protein n=1 Tax=Noviherbaspirillum humi TaxID=1688639 RepID=A0A239IPP1_9BURK|nr:hypothetical protein [Noviherbaspirillum humi]SNS95342.1 hypothetical protein SAMN06265795_11051 [Noviherbaspirillum humi]